MWNIFRTVTRGRLALQFFALLGLSFILGLITEALAKNSFRKGADLATGSLSDNQKDPFADELAIRTLSLVEARVLHARKDTLFLDARTRGHFEKGRIAGARSLPSEQFDESFANQLDLFVGVKACVAYCGGTDCQQSLHLAEKLRDIGISVMIFPGGWNEWRRANLPVEP